MAVSTPVLVTVLGNEVVFAESIHSADFQMNWRKETFAKVLYVQRGRVKLSLQNGQEIEVNVGHTGAVFLISAQTSHRIADLLPSVILLMCLGTDWLQRDGLNGLGDLWNRLSPLVLLELSGTTATHWERLWRQALLEQEHTRAEAEVLREALAMQLLVILARHPQRQIEDSPAERVRRVSHEMSETIFDGWTIDRASVRAGLSRRHFTHWFRAVNGQSFVNFLNNQRLDHAERLLKSGRHSVTGAAFSSGFEDLAHFYRLFKKRHHQPPGNWLKKNVKKTHV